MVAKLLRLSQITNGGEGSGEHEGHEFRGNQWSNMPTPDASHGGYVGTKEYKDYLDNNGISKEAQDKVETSLFQHSGNSSEQEYGDKSLVESIDNGGEELKMLLVSSDLEEYAAKSVEDYHQKETQEKINELDKISPDNVDRTGKDEFNADRLVGYSPKHEPEEYNDAWKESKQRLEEKLKEPMMIYRKSSSDDSSKQILSFTRNKEGAVTNPITGGDLVISPNVAWTLEDVKAKGYRIISGFARQRGRSGEAEVLLMKVDKKKNIVNIGIEDSISSIVKKYLDISTTNHQKKRIPKTVAKLLRLSQITNGGEGSGEHEGHEFRGNQYGDTVLDKASKEGFVVYSGTKSISTFDSDGGISSYAGVSSDTWSSWAQDPEPFQDALRGVRPSGRDANGELITEKDADEYMKNAPKIQEAAESHLLPVHTVYRGESFENEADIKKKYPIGKIVTLDKLTSTTFDRDVAEVYASSANQENSNQVILVMQGAHPFQGIQTALSESGFLGNEAVLPKGQQWRVSRIQKIDGKTEISLYRSGSMKPPKGLSVVGMVPDDTLSKIEKNIKNLSIEDSISSIVKKYLESNIDASSNGISSSHLIGSLVAKGNLQENPMVSFDLLRQQSLDYAMEHTKRLIDDGGETIHGEFKPWLKDASEELRSSISTTITDGINKGKSRDQIKQDLRDIYAGDEARIDKIAGWEIPNAQYHGSMDQYEEDGITIFEWLLGDSPCDVCEPYGEKRYFTAEELPPDLPHPRCQCDIVPVSSSQMVSMVKRLIHGGEGSGEHEGHEFRGNQYSGNLVRSSPDDYSIEGYKSKASKLLRNFKKEYHSQVESLGSPKIYAANVKEKLAGAYYNKPEYKVNENGVLAYDHMSGTVIISDMSSDKPKEIYRKTWSNKQWDPTSTDSPNSMMYSYCSDILRQGVEGKDPLWTMGQNHPIRDISHNMFIFNGGEGSGEKEGHEFRGNQWSGLVSSATKNIHYDKDSDTVFSNMSYDEIKSTYDSIEGPKEISPSVIGYTKDDFRVSNLYLRGKEEEAFSWLSDEMTSQQKIDWAKGSILGMDEAISDDSKMLPQGLELWRGVGENTGKSVANMQIGDICQDTAFQSFSLDPSSADRFSRHWDSEDMDINKDSEKDYMDKYDKNIDSRTFIRAITTGEEKALKGDNYERELIFDRGTKWQVVDKEEISIDKKHSIHIVTVVHHG